MKKINPLLFIFAFVVIVIIGSNIYIDQKFDSIVESSGMVICSYNDEYCIKAEDPNFKSSINRYYDLKSPRFSWCSFDTYYDDCFGSKLDIIWAYDKIIKLNTEPIPIK